MPKLLKIKTTDEFIQFTHEVSRTAETVKKPDKANPGETKDARVVSVEEHTITAHEAPLPAFDKAFRALAAVAAKVLECSPDWADGVTVTTLAITYTKTGIRTVVLGFCKSINATSTLHPMKTPAFQIDDGKTADDGRKQCTPMHAELVDEAIKQAQRYAAGERSQQMLKFEDEKVKEDKDAKLVQLPGIDPEQ